MSNTKLEAMRAMVARAPGNALARYGLANELVKEGLHEEAVEALKVYLASHEDEGSGFRLLAQSYRALGKTDAAIDAYERGMVAATKFNHPSMAAEFEEAVEDLRG